VTWRFEDYWESSNESRKLLFYCLSQTRVFLNVYFKLFDQAF
jgi:hypothetical protein